MQRTMSSITGWVGRMRRVVRLLTAIAVTAATLTAVPAAHAADYVSKDVFAPDVPDMLALAEAVDEFASVAGAFEKKVRISKAELDEVGARGASVKRATPGFQRSAASLVNRLKSAGKWTPELDAFVERRLRDRNAPAWALDELKKQGGARGLFQRATTLPTEVTRSVDADLAALRNKQTVLRLLEPLLGTPVHAGIIHSIQRGVCTVVRTVCSLADLGCLCSR